MTGSSHESAAEDRHDAEVAEAEIVPETAVVPVPPSVPEPDYSTAGVPSFDYVRGKIEDRFATSVGGAELAAETPEGRSLDEQEAERARKAADKLAEIRRSLGRS